MNISIGSDIAAIILLMVVLAFLLVFKQWRTKSGLAFVFICASSILSIFCDLICWLADGDTNNPNNYYINFAFNVMLIIGLLTSIVFINIHSFYRSNNYRKFNVLMHYFAIVSYFIFVSFIIFSLPFNMIFHIDKTTFLYVRGNYYYLSYVFILFFCVQNIVMVLYNRKFFNLPNLIRLCFLSGLPIILGIIHIILYRFIGLNTLSYGLYSLGIAIIYVNDQQFAILDAGFDKMTNLRNHSNYLRMVNNDYRNLRSCGLILFDVSNLKEVNDKYGHNAGDELIVLVANSIKRLEASNITSFRIGGNEFVTIYANCNKNEVNEYIEKWKKCMEKETTNFAHSIIVSFGSSFAGENVNLDYLLKEVNETIYCQKVEYKQQKKIKKQNAK